MLNRSEVSVRQLTHIVEKPTSTILAILPALLHFRELQSLKSVIHWGEGPTKH